MTVSTPTAQVAYLCTACGARLLLSGPKRPSAMAAIIRSHEQSDRHRCALLRLRRRPLRTSAAPPMHQLTAYEARTAADQWHARARDLITAIRADRSYGGASDSPDRLSELRLAVATARTLRQLARHRTTEQ